jgi:FtsH-binding integral membrane protein
MSIVMLVNIWFPETIDEELIWKIILSYAVFLISALVIANLTDKVKNMKQFEEEK